MVGCLTLYTMPVFYVVMFLCVVLVMCVDNLPDINAFIPYTICCVLVLVLTIAILTFMVVVVVVAAVVVVVVTNGV